MRSFLCGLVGLAAGLAIGLAVAGVMDHGKVARLEAELLAARAEGDVAGDKIAALEADLTNGRAHVGDLLAALRERDDARGQHKPDKHDTWFALWAALDKAAADRAVPEELVTRTHDKFNAEADVWRTSLTRLEDAQEGLRGQTEELLKERQFVQRELDFVVGRTGGYVKWEPLLERHVSLEEGPAGEASSEAEETAKFLNYARVQGAR